MKAKNHSTNRYIDMRKDVKRSLIFWPALASIIVTFVGVFATGGQGVIDWTKQQIHDAMLAMSDASVESTSAPSHLPGRIRAESPNDLSSIERFSDVPLPELTLKPEPVIRRSEPAEPSVVAVPEPAIDAPRELTAAPLDVFRPDPTPLLTRAPSSIGPTPFELVERSDQGERGMATPNRLATVMQSRKQDPTVTIASNRPSLQADVPDTQSLDATQQESDLSLSLQPAMSNQDSPSNEIINGDLNAITIDTEPLFQPAASNQQRPDMLANRTVSRSAGTATSGDDAVELRQIEPISPEPILESNADEISALQTGTDQIGEIMPRRVSDDLQPEPDTSSLAADRNDESQRSTSEGNPGGWPRCKQLDSQLKQLIAISRGPKSHEGDTIVSTRTNLPHAMARWATDVQSTLQRLQELDRIGSPQAGTLIEELSRLSMLGSEAAEEVSDRDQQIHWLRAAHAVARRTAVWQPVWKLANLSTQSSWVGDEDRLSVLMPKVATPIDPIETAQSLRQELGDGPAAQQWADYLMLSKIIDAATTQDANERVLVARQLVGRIENASLSPQQRAWLSSDRIMELVGSVRPWVSVPIDYAALLGQLERTESNSIDLVSTDIADAIYSLRYAEGDSAREVAETIETHYRNANVRFAMSQELLHRMLPDVPAKFQPVRARVLGSRVVGTSEVHSDLAVQLVPNPVGWSVALQTLGNVTTRSIGRKGPAAVSTAGKNHFIASTQIDVTPSDIDVSRTNVSVNGRTRLRGIETQFDGWPLIGPLVQAIAENQYRGGSGIAQRIANRRVSQSVSRELDDTIQQRIDQASEQFSDAVLGPLNRLRLDPQVIDLSTTSQRLVARYRMASESQLSAFTPRPRPPHDSLMSLQVHQSALNNTLQQLVARDDVAPIRDIMQDCLNVLGQGDVELPNDLPEDVRVRFTKTRPVTFEFEDGIVWLTMRIIRFEKGDRTKLTNFIVRASYRPEIDGLEARLVREGHLSISGPGMSMRERLPVRAIFNKVLSSSRPLPITSQRLTSMEAADGLAISQLELRDGWLGLAISESSPDPSTDATVSQERVATRPE